MGYWVSGFEFRFVFRVSDSGFRVEFSGFEFRSSGSEGSHSWLGDLERRDFIGDGDGELLCRLCTCRGREDVSVTLFVGNPLCPYGIAYSRRYGSVTAGSSKQFFVVGCVVQPARCLGWPWQDQKIKRCQKLTALIFNCQGREMSGCDVPPCSRHDLRTAPARPACQLEISGQLTLSS